MTRGQRKPPHPKPPVVGPTRGGYRDAWADLAVALDALAAAIVQDLARVRQARARHRRAKIKARMARLGETVMRPVTPDEEQREREVDW